MKPLQKALRTSIDSLPRVALVKILAPKFKAARIRDYRRKAEELADHILASEEDSFAWGEGDENEEIVISFDEDDHRELERIAAKFTDSLKDLIPKLTRTTAQRVLRVSIRRWREERYVELRQQYKRKTSLLGAS